MNTAIRRTLAVILAAVALTAGCGSDSEVGTAVGAEGDGEGGSVGIGVTTTSKGEGGGGAAGVTTAPPTTAPPETTTTAAPETTTTTAAPQSIIRIQDDETGANFEPRVMQVPAGSTVTWVNATAKGAVRSVQASDQTFVSPDIPPGGSWSWTAVHPGGDGTIEYKDGTRPYAVAYLQVY